MEYPDGVFRGRKHVISILISYPRFSMRYNYINFAMSTGNPSKSLTMTFRINENVLKKMKEAAEDRVISQYFSESNLQKIRRMGYPRTKVGYDIYSEVPSNPAF